MPGSKEGRSPNNIEALAENPEFAFLSWGGLFSGSPFSEFIGIERALRLVDVSLAAELTFTERWRSVIKVTYPYHEVNIPLKGYNGLDFSVNKDIKTWRGMVDRGYEATAAKLVSAGLIPGSARKKNPYRP
jgi:hypothetical protein